MNFYALFHLMQIIIYATVCICMYDALLTYAIVNNWRCVVDGRHTLPNTTQHQKKSKHIHIGIYNICMYVYTVISMSAIKMLTHKRIVVVK